MLSIHPQARTTPAVRQEIARSTEPTGVLAQRFERGPDWQPFAVQDGNLITGQNPQSSELVARHVLSSLGKAA